MRDTARLNPAAEKARIYQSPPRHKHRTPDRSQLADAGITPDKRVAFYCGTGWRTSETWFYAYLMGWDRIAVYNGGWFEWSQDP